MNIQKYSHSIALSSMVKTLRTFVTDSLLLFFSPSYSISEQNPSPHIMVYKYTVYAYLTDKNKHIAILLTWFFESENLYLN